MCNDYKEHLMNLLKSPNESVAQHKNRSRIFPIIIHGLCLGRNHGPVNVAKDGFKATCHTRAIVTDQSQ